MAEVDVSWREVFQALVIASVIGVIDEGLDGQFKCSRQMVVRGWSRKFGLVVKVDCMAKEVIQSAEAKEPFT